MKQKKWNIGPERRKAIEEEVGKLIAAKFIREAR